VSGGKSDAWRPFAMVEHDTIMYDGRRHSRWGATEATSGSTIVDGVLDDSLYTGSAARDYAGWSLPIDGVFSLFADEIKTKKMKRR